MKEKPIVEMIPLKSAVRKDAPTELAILVRIVAPQMEIARERPQLNLGLVLDRSGSMSGAKLRAVKDAAKYAVQQLKATDRVAVTIYDSEVETIVPSTNAGNKETITRKINGIECGGATALHDGWVEGGMQVSRHLDTKGLNRVLLLTDGLANHGETNVDRICSDVKGLASRGVSTTTMGVGNDFNEDLLQAMSQSGDGNYYFIEGAGDLERIFAGELRGLMATVGHTVSLGIEPQGGSEAVDVMNDLERNKLGRLQLPNLVAGNAIEVVVKLQVSAQSVESDVCFVRLAWSTPDSSERFVVREALSLPSVSSGEWDALPENERVADAVALLETARIRQQAVEELERGDIAAARSSFSRGRSLAGNIKDGAAAAEEAALFEVLDGDFDKGEHAHLSKLAKAHNYKRRRSQSD